MKAQTQKMAAPISTPFYYGWMIVLISALGVFFSGPGQTYSISVFIDSISKSSAGAALKYRLFILQPLLHPVCACFL